MPFGITRNPSMQLSLNSAWGAELCLGECLGIIGQSPLVLIEILQTQGSVPRETGTWMLVTDQLAS